TPERRVAVRNLGEADSEWRLQTPLSRAPSRPTWRVSQSYARRRLQHCGGRNRSLCGLPGLPRAESRVFAPHSGGRRTDRVSQWVPAVPASERVERPDALGCLQNNCTVYIRTMSNGEFAGATR